MLALKFPQMPLLLQGGAFLMSLLTMAHARLVSALPSTSFLFFLLPEPDVVPAEAVGSDSLPAGLPHALAHPGWGEVAPDLPQLLHQLGLQLVELGDDWPAIGNMKPSATTTN